MRFLTFVLFFASNTASAQQLEIQQFLEVEWETTTIEETELANQVSDLYVTLYNTGNLPTIELPLAEFGTPLEAFAASGAYFTRRVLPPALDGLLCDLNPEHCSRTRTIVGQDSLESFSGHVGGYAATQPRWTAGPDATLVVPFLEFEQTTRLDRKQQPTGWTPDNYVASANLDCSQWDTTCAEIVRQFNPHILPLPGGLIEATVPTPSLTATLRLRADDMAQIAEDFRDGFETLSPDAQVRAYVNPLPTASNEWRQEFNSQSQLDMAIRGLSENLPLIGTFREYSGHSHEPYFENQAELFKLINHPFGQGLLLGDVYQEPIGVFVIDGKVEKRHCDWPDVKLSNGAEMPVDGAGIDPPTAILEEEGNENAPLYCNEIYDAAISGTDHATHVAGIIAAQLNGKGMVGLNPYAQLYFLHYDRALPANKQLTELSNKMFMEIPSSGAKVANMSIGLDRRVGSSRKIQELFNLFQSGVLFVAAAGNDGLHMNWDGSDCEEYPACLNELDNIITVVGINRDALNPEPWKDGGQASNTSPTFDIAAVAENVLSTVSVNRYGHMSGTSQAAPQVAATASLIFSAGEAIFNSADPLKQTTPKIVKDRLSYTGDLVPQLLDDVWGGRLNVERAIDVANARFELFDGRVIIGQIEDAPWDFQCATGIRAERERSLSATRRIVWNEVSQQFVIFHNTEIVSNNRGNRFKPLDRFDSCTLATRNARFYVRVRKSPGDEGELVNFKFSEVRDYTSRLFD